MKKPVLLIGVLVLGLIMSPAAWAKTVIKCQNSLPDRYAASKALADFAGQVKDQTKGEVEIQIFPTGQLFKDTDLPTALPTGAIDACLPNLGQWAGLVPALGAMSMVGLFDSAEHFSACLKGGLGEMWAKQLEEKANTKVVAWLTLGPADIITSPKKTFKTAEDFKGLKMNTATKGMQIYFQALGAVPTSISASDVYLALQRGTIEAAASAALSVLGRKWVEVSKNQTRLMMIPEAIFPILFNLDSWKKLTPEQQKIVAEAGQGAREWNFEQVSQDNDKAWAELAKMDGVKVESLDAEAAGKLNKIAAPANQEYLFKTLGQEMADKVMKLVDEAR